MKKTFFVLYVVLVLLWVPLLLFGGIQNENQWLKIATGVSIGLAVVSSILFFVGLATPLFVNRLVNNPRGAVGEPDPPIEPGKLHFFTFIEHGQVKIKVRGKKFAGAIMDDPERVFRKIGEAEKNADYWWIRPAGKNEISEPLPPLELLAPLSWWAHWVYHWEGAVFVGLLFTRIRVTKNQRERQKKVNGSVVIDEKTGLPVLEEVEDWSDHLRTKAFPWYFKIPSLDTKDFQKIGVEGYLLVRCINPYLSGYNQERWDNILTSQIKVFALAFTSSKTFKELSTATPEQLYEFADFLKIKLNTFLNPPEIEKEDKRGAGFEILEVGITDRNPQLSQEDQRALTEQWRAEQAAMARVTTAEATKTARIKESEGERQAEINISEGKAQAIVNRIIAIKTGGEIGMLIAQYDAWRDSAHAGGSTFFFGDKRDGADRQTDQLVFAKLQEIHRTLMTQETGRGNIEKTPDVTPTEPPINQKSRKNGLRKLKIRGNQS